MHTTILLAATLIASSHPESERPSWATASVPDTVIALVERATDVADSDERKRLLLEAEGHARASVVGFETDVGRRYALAVVLGLRANNEGGQTKVEAASDLSRELNAILEMDPAHAGARHMLGRLHAGVRRMNRVTRWIATNLLGGDELGRATWALAEENLAYAERQEPGVSDHHLQLALLFRDTDRHELARAELTHVLAMEPTNVLEEEIHAEARQVWSDLER